MSESPMSTVARTTRPSTLSGSMAGNASASAASPVSPADASAASAPSPVSAASSAPPPTATSSPRRPRRRLRGRSGVGRRSVPCRRRPALVFDAGDDRLYLVDTGEDGSITSAVTSIWPWRISSGRVLDGVGQVGPVVEAHGPEVPLEGCGPAGRCPPSPRCPTDRTRDRAGELFNAVIASSLSRINASAYWSSMVRLPPA